MTRTLVGRLLVVGALAVTAPLGAQSVSAVPGTPYNTTGISSEVRGRDMAGMSVQVCMSNGCDSYTWGNLPGSFWGVESRDFRIRVGSNEDTYTGDWRFDLYNRRDLRSVTFSGFGGNTVFDRTRPSPGTPGSDRGLDGDLRNRCFLSWSGLDCVDFSSGSVEYRNAVSLNGVGYGDLYESVFIDFSNVSLSGPNAGGGLDEDYSAFYLWMDTDNARLTQVPEPASLGLLAVGSLGLIGAVRRRRNR